MNVNTTNKYCVVTPCRNEEQHLAETIRTMVAQSHLPTTWVIVDDGSTDATPQILEEACREHAFIQVVRREDRGKRSVGPGVIDAFYCGLESLDLGQYDFLCKLDADLELPPEYFERVIARMEADPLLGNFSGKVYVRLDDGQLIREELGDENAIGAAKFYRTDCFEEIGGFERASSWDGIDGHMCRMKGWIAASEDDPRIRIIHRRLMGSSQDGIKTGRIRWGAGKYYMGSAWYFVLASCVRRIMVRPYVLGSIWIMQGYLTAWFKKAPRFADLEFRRFLRKYEFQSLFQGKKKTTEQFNARIRQAAAEKAHTS